MNHTRRITPAEVLEAYRVTGLKPMRKTIFKKGFCCGIGALICASPHDKRGDPRFRWWEWDELALEFIEAHFGRTYGFGFVAAFDGEGISEDERQGHSERWNEGYADGIACAAAVFGETVK